MCTFVLVTNDDETGTINDGNGSELPVFFCGRATHTLTRTQTEREFTLEKTDSSKTFLKYFHTVELAARASSGHFCVLRGRLSTENCLPLLPDRSDGPGFLSRGRSLFLTKTLRSPSLSLLCATFALLFFARTVSLLHTQTRARTNTNTRLLRDAFKYVCECVN